jgi:ankyrin repeat protein
VLDEIHSTNQGRHAHRLLQCLTVAMRPLRVEELAEVLAFELDAAEGELPRFHPDWRWEDQEHAVLSACSSLITIVNSDDSRVIQFSHFSVKEYLTSERLSTSSGDITGYHIALEPAHLILAQACLGALLNVDTCVNKEYNESGDEAGSLYSDEVMPLCEYAAQHWTSHAQVGNVSSCLKDAMETLFDPNKPYFEAWIQIQGQYDYEVFKQSQLYFAALHGFYDLVQHLIDRHPEQVTHHNHTYFSPLVAALESGKHVRVAELLFKHGAHVHIRGDPPLFHAITFSDDGRVNAVQFLLKHGAHVNAGDAYLMTPLHFAAQVGCPKVARILLEHGADVCLKMDDGKVPLHLVSDLGNKDEEERLVLARLLLVRSCADVNARDFDGATPLHYASYHRRPRIVQLLLDHGANIHAEDNQGRNPLHQMSSSVREFVNPRMFSESHSFYSNREWT